MINHVVVFKFKMEFSESDIYSALNQFGALKEIISGMRSFSFGKKCSIEQLNKGFTHAFIMQFVDVNARDAYVNHKEHQRIAADVIVPMLEHGLDSVVVIDYESE